MRGKDIKKSSLLVIVLFMGVFFLIGSAAKHGGDDFDPLDPSVLVPLAKNAANTQRQKEASNLSHSNKTKFDKLMAKRKALREEIADTRQMRWRKKSDGSWELSSIKIAQLEKKHSTLTKEVDKLLAESKVSCFPKDTKVVMYDGSLKAIDTIKKGDQVMIYNIANDTIGTSIVNEKYVDNNNHMYILNNSIQATAYERFLTQDGWKRMNSINTTDSVFNGNSFIDVNSISKVKKDLAVYNLNINSAHNFFVSYGQNDEWFLIHNSGGGGGGAGGVK